MGRLLRAAGHARGQIGHIVHPLAKHFRLSEHVLTAGQPSHGIKTAKTSMMRW